MSEENGRSAAVERAEIHRNRKGDRCKATERGAEKEPKEEHDEENGGNDLLPEMDGAESLGFDARLVTDLLGTSGLDRTGEEKPEEAAERTGVAMIMGVGDHEQEADGKQHQSCCHTISSDAFAFHVV